MNPTRIAAVFRRHWIVLIRSPHRWFEISFWPMVDVLLWGALGVFVAKQAASGSVQSQSSAPFLLAGITLFWTFTQSQFAIALGVNEETWSRNILNVFTTSIKETEYLIGIALFGLLKLVLCLLTLTLVTTTLFHFNLGDVGWISVPIIALLVINGWALGLIGVGLVLRFGQSAEILIWGVNYMFLAFSGVFFPASSLPHGFREFSQIVPTTKLFGAMRAALSGESVRWGSLVTPSIASFVLLGLAIAFATKLLGVFRTRGFVTRYS